MTFVLCRDKVALPRSQVVLRATRCAGVDDTRASETHTPSVKQTRAEPAVLHHCSTSAAEQFDWRSWCCSPPAQRLHT